MNLTYIYNDVLKRFSSITLNQPRTNNSGIWTRVSHPTIWSFIDNLWKGQKAGDNDFNQP